MRQKIQLLFVFMAFVIKFILSLVISEWFIALAYSLFFTLTYLILSFKKYNISSYLPFVMMDFIVGFYFIFHAYGFSLFSVLFSLVYFILSSGFLYYLLIDYLGKITSSKWQVARSNVEIDKGIKALENNEYEEALKAFESAIKEHKRNYLGYMGICNTLTKLDKKNLKEISYYKKKCIKYAPKNLKETINNKY